MPRPRNRIKPGDNAEHNLRTPWHYITSYCVIIHRPRFWDARYTRSFCSVTNKCRTRNSYLTIIQRRGCIARSIYCTFRECHRQGMPRRYYYTFEPIFPRTFRDRPLQANEPLTFCQFDRTAENHRTRHRPRHRHHCRETITRRDGDVSRRFRFADASPPWIQILTLNSREPPVRCVSGITFKVAGITNSVFS